MKKIIIPFILLFLFACASDPSSYQKESGLWQEYKAKQAHDDLDKQIDRQANKDQ